MTGACGPWRVDGDYRGEIHVAYGETELRQQLRAMRARWDAERKLWYVRYGLIRGTPLVERLAERYA
ncbi:DUF5710 domain-containing protein [Geobacter sp. AOG1]|uniref:DUF5710 domain-containing protein n=1 Tax=Geobacter sp. AOG1 TaxID=1566346 RepID=UPI001CC579A0|nr:DUF5710 domain-containing protein [Geobacter sp. AOG1]